MDIFDRINASRSRQDKSNDNGAVNEYLQEINQKALHAAKLSVAVEMEKLRMEKKAIAESMDALVSSHKEQVLGLESSLVEIKKQKQNSDRTAAMHKADFDDSASKFETVLNIHKNTIQELSIDNSWLKGKLENQKQPERPIVQTVVKNRPIQSYEVIPHRGPDGRINRGTITPILAKEH